MTTISSPLVAISYEHANATENIAEEFANQFQKLIENGDYAVDKFGSLAAKVKVDDSEKKIYVEFIDANHAHALCNAIANELAFPVGNVFYWTDKKLWNGFQFVSAELQEVVFFTTLFLVFA